MLKYILLLLSLIISILSVLSSLRFFFSKKFYFWILPLAFSLLLAFSNFISIFFPALAVFNASWDTLSLFPFILSLLWYVIIIFLRYSFKRSITKNRIKSDALKNLTEARYLEKIERRRFKKYDKIIRDTEKYGAVKPVSTKQMDNWIDLFDK